MPHHFIIKDILLFCKHSFCNGGQLCFAMNYLGQNILFVLSVLYLKWVYSIFLFPRFFSEVNVL